MCPGSCPSAAAAGARGVWQQGLGVARQLSGTGATEKELSELCLCRAGGSEGSGRAVGELSRVRCPPAAVPVQFFISAVTR